MNSFATHLVKRGMEAHAAVDIHATKASDDAGRLLSALAITCLALTFVIFIVTLAMTEYTYSHLIPTLAMVEIPSAVLVETVTTEEKEDATDKEPFLEHTETVLVQEKPITASLHKTMKHLRSVGGSRGRLRGFTFFFVYAVVLGQLSVLLSFLPFRIGSILAATVLANLRMGWVHVIISKPSQLSWFRRIPTWKSFRAIAGVTALTAVVEELAVGLPVFLANVLGLDTSRTTSGSTGTEAERSACLMKLLCCVVVALGWAIFVVIPMTAVLSRVQASLLKESEETIVPVHHDGPMTITEAWKSLDWNARVRILKTYVKGMAIQMVIILLFGAAIIGQLVAFAGSDFHKKLSHSVSH